MICAQQKDLLSHIFLVAYVIPVFCTGRNRQVINGVVQFSILFFSVYHEAALQCTHFMSKGPFHAYLFLFQNEGMALLRLHIEVLVVNFFSVSTGGCANKKNCCILFQDYCSSRSCDPEDDNMLLPLIEVLTVLQVLYKLGTTEEGEGLSLKPEDFYSHKLMNKITKQLQV